MKYLNLMFVCVFLAGCGFFKPVVVWDIWGPQPQNCYEEALRTWACYKGDGTGYLYHGYAKNGSGHTELWIDEHNGKGPQPVGFSPLSISGKVLHAEVIKEKPSDTLMASTTK